MGSALSRIVMRLDVSCCRLFLGQSGLRLEGGMDDRAVAGKAGRLDEFIVPLHGELLRRLVDERLDEGVQVARVQAGCVSATRPGTLRWPTTFTPFVVRPPRPAGDFALPPRSTARSTITEPGFIDSTMARETSSGPAGLESARW